MKKIILIMVIICTTQIVFAQEEEQHLKLGEEVIKGELEKPKTEFIIDKAQPKFKEIQPDANLLMEVLEPQKEIPQKEAKANFDIKKASIWTTSAVGVSTGVISVYMYNQDKPEQAKNLAAVSLVSSSISLLTYLLR